MKAIKIAILLCLISFPGRSQAVGIAPLALFFAAEKICKFAFVYWVVKDKFEAPENKPDILTWYLDSMASQDIDAADIETADIFSKTIDRDLVKLKEYTKNFNPCIKRYLERKNRTLFIGNRLEALRNFILEKSTINEEASLENHIYKRYSPLLMSEIDRIELAGEKSIKLNEKKLAEILLNEVKIKLSEGVNKQGLRNFIRSFSIDILDEKKLIE